MACLSVAALFRTWHLSTVPPGLHLDEATDIHQVMRVLNGEHFIYTPTGWGREALYYYFAAPTLLLVRDGLLGVRLTTALCGLLLVLLAYWLVRRLFDATTALLTAAWMSVTFWPVFTSRVGVRNISLSVMLTLTVMAFWWAWRSPSSDRGRRWARSALAGLLLGSCLYTYQSARVVPLVFVLFACYTLLFHRAEFRANWRGLLIFFAVAAVVAVPLLVFFSRHPAAEGTERAAMLEPFHQLLAGDPMPILANGLALLKMFTVHGDPLRIYNLPGRSVLPGLAVLPFYAGLLVCLWRWRRPAYCLMLLWLAVMLLPSLVTISAPHFFRTMAAQIPTLFLPALGVATAAQLAGLGWGRWGRSAVYLIALLILGQTAWLTWNDYFYAWPSIEEVRLLYNERLAALTRYLNETPDDTPTVVGARQAEDAGPYITSASLRHDRIPLRWVLPTSAIAFPAEQPNGRFILVADTLADQYFEQHFLKAEHKTEEVRLPDDSLALSIYQLVSPTTGIPLPEREYPQDGPWAAPPGIELPAAPTEDLIALPLPVRFGDQVELLSYALSGRELHPGETLRLVSAWRVLRDGWPSQLVMFTHLLDNQSRVLAQQDRLGYPLEWWRTDDIFVQVHYLTIDEGAAAGRYWLQIGFYERAVYGRWPVSDTAGEPISDRLLLGQVEVAP